MADTTSSELLSRSRQPVYLQLATIFRRQIESGAWRQGERIPSLEALCRQYGVARMHHAPCLVDTRRRRAGGALARARGTSSAPCQARRQVSLSTSWDEAVAVGAQLDTEAMVESAGNVPLPADLGMPCPAERAAEYHFLRRLHRLEGRPFAVGEVYIEAASCARAEPSARAPRCRYWTASPGLSVSSARSACRSSRPGPNPPPRWRLPWARRWLNCAACCVPGERGELIVYYARIEFPTEFVCLDFDLLAGRRARPDAPRATNANLLTQNLSGTRDMETTQPMNGAESLVKTLLANGVDTCFANPGTSEMHFVAALDRIPGMRCVLGLFEGVVTGAADGYARMAGKPAATLLHCGPGLANGLANLHNARRAQTPVVNIIGDQATYHRRWTHR